MSLALIGFHGDAKTQKAQQAESDQKPATPVTSPQVKQSESSAPQSKPEQHIQADVRIIEAPTKDRYDKTAFWVSIVLAGVGIAGIIIGVCTLRFLSSQAVEMRRQRIVMARTMLAIRRQAAQMEEQLKEMRKVSEIENKTLILQYRPRVILRNAILDGVSLDLQKIAEGKTSFQIVNVGGSPARIIGGHLQLLAITTGATDEIKTMEGNKYLLPNGTLQPGERGSSEVVLSTGAENDLGWIDFYQGGTESKRYLYLLGQIWYRDDLDIPRQTGIYRKYNQKTRRFDPQKDSEEEYSD